MSEPGFRQRTSLRVRLDECDGTGSVTTGRLFALADEARFDLYDGLAARGVAVPKRQSVRAERLSVVRAPRTREAIVVDVHVGRVGRTSFELVHLVRDANDALLAELVTTVVALSSDGPTAIDPSIRDHAHDPSTLALDPPCEPERSVAFLRTLEAWPAHENQGRHVARTRMVDFLVDAYRMGVRAEAFEHDGANAKATLRSIALLYEREAFAGDGLRIAVASVDAQTFDAELSRKGESVTRARITTVR